ncbi:hypothetical protein BpHYR1_005508 [Brachionus plicatilis]|uniref:Uncharacterized protein n=1 Tax=Brachionus plicatilis TaxID=10195 RepID=A0A3M7QHS3_BRAPC|nr:hypothetical protein BpHYR1_005508 [Brachionus plicatilis]
MVRDQLQNGFEYSMYLDSQPLYIPLFGLSARIAMGMVFLVVPKMMPKMMPVMILSSIIVAIVSTVSSKTTIAIIWISITFLNY